MFATRIDRYIIREVLSPTLLCLLVFTMVLLMGRLVKLVEMVVNKGVSLSDILILFGTMLPAFLNMTLPLAFLMGIMIGLSRMSADSETIAIKAAGIGLAQIARPVLVLALIVALLTGIAGLWLKPWGYSAFREQIFAITMQKATIGLQPQVFMKQFNNIVLYANDINNRTGRMQDIFILEKKPEAIVLIFAEQGDLVSDPARESISFQLQNGTIHRQQADLDSTFQLIHFRHYDVQPDLTSDESLGSTRQNREKRPKEMSSGELWNEIRSSEADARRPRVQAAKAEFHARLASSMAPLIFALFGLPFSIQSHRSGRSGGFVIGLMIYLGYYLLFSLAQTFTAEAGMAPLLSFWFPHLLLTGAGLYCLYQSAHERPNIFVTRVEQALVSIRTRIKRSHEHA